MILLMSAHDKIVKYYQLCALRMGDAAHNASANIFSAEELAAFLRKRDGNYVAREIVVGGATSTQRNDLAILVF